MDNRRLHDAILHEFRVSFGELGLRPLQRYWTEYSLWLYSLFLHQRRFLDEIFLAIPGSLKGVATADS